MSEIYVVFQVADQVSGGNVAVSTLKAFKSASEAEKFRKSQAGGRRVIPTDIGNLECDVTIGVHAVELEE